MYVPEYVGFQTKFMDPVEQVAATHVLTPKSERRQVAYAFGRPMRNQDVGIVGDCLPFLKQRLAPIQHKRPVHECGCPG